MYRKTFLTDQLTKERFKLVRLCGLQHVVDLRSSWVSESWRGASALPLGPLATYLTTRLPRPTEKNNNSYFTFFKG